MNNLKNLLTTLCLGICSATLAQNLTWDRQKYPDLPDPNPKNINMDVYKKMLQRVKQAEAEGKRRPDHVNNALYASFPPIINQSGGSCGAASTVYYQFTTQINTARFTAADTDEHRYATHFPWMLNTNSPKGTSYERLGHDVGIASVAVYGGTTYSRLYGNSGQDDQDDDCGWMQGYDSWFSTMHNRILTGNSFPYNCGTEEGREIVKNYLWNRCGDDSYSSGGVCGIGVAAGPFEGTIPQTEANDAAGVTGMKYVTDWNETYNHAMTIVGYDDRIEFDLDGNGVIGEAKNADGDNEVGAWIICNSWGDGYANNGFIYCPYEKSNCVKGWPKENSFKPGFLEVMRDYRPLRTMRVKMEYTHRSEMALYVGVAQDPTATQPEESTVLTHFEYCGDGNNGKTQPAPEIPMLGRWADGQLHTEPMEFGYDLTDLTAGFDLMRPLKYFFWVETRSWGVGSGKVHEVSIIDYTLDRDGVEIPFELNAPVAVASGGQKTEMTAVVMPQSVPAPFNPVISDGQLAWQAPVGSRYQPATYNIYCGGTLHSRVPAEVLTAEVDADGSYSVSATYHINGHDIESKRSASVIAIAEPASEVGINLLGTIKRGSKILIPELVAKATPNFTLEFWMRPRSGATSDSYGIKATTTNFFFKVINGGQIEVGHDGGDYRRSTSKLTGGTFHHIAIVNKGLNMQVLVDGKSYINYSSGYGHQGLEAATGLIFGETEGTTSQYKVVYDALWNADIDEIRFWTCARTLDQIKKDASTPIAYPALHDQLTHYYTMATRQQGDDLYLIDAKKGSDAIVQNPATFAPMELAYDNRISPLSLETFADFTTSRSITAGQQLSLQDLSSLGTIQWEWDITGAREPNISGTPQPVVVFDQAGTQTIHLKTTHLFGAQAEKSMEVEVLPATTPTVDFSVPEGEIGAGQHVTFRNLSSPIETATYEWEIEGAEVPVVKTANAAATFNAEGTYTVRLTAYHNQGTTTKTKTVSVTGVRPQAAFTIRNNIALCGEPFSLIDESKFAPKEWTWDIASGVEIYRVQGQSKALSIDVPGIYDVTLTTANSKGSSVLTRRSAIVVCNADGKNGLQFDGTDDLVQAPSPFDETTSEFTIDWWMYPARLTEDGDHFGDQASNFRFCVKPNGAISVDINGKNVTSAEGMVLFDQWHHYAITFKRGTFIFYRDTQKISSGRQNGIYPLPTLQHFAIGGTERPFKGILDELRIWNYQVTQKNLLALANSPVDAPEHNDSLLLYYDFNQNSGDVIDRSGHELTGQRLNFGPDGDAWENTKGIFCINPKGDYNDVTDSYLKNYKHPFKYSGTCNPANSSRYLRLLMNKTTSPWVQKNTVKNGSIYTEWHVDAQKNNYLTLEDTYSGFEPVIKDLMIFQTIELPEGEYTFIADRDGDTYYYNWLTDGTYVAAAAADELPLTADLEEQALAWSKLSESGAISFSLSEPTTVSLGLIANMSDKKCVAVGKFILRQKAVIHEEGIDIGPTDGIGQPFVSATSALQATGGFGTIKIQVTKPQHVTIADLSGKVIFHDWLESTSIIPARKGIYIVNRQKVLVR